MKFAYFELPGNIGGSGVKMKVFVLIKIVYIFLGKVLPLKLLYCLNFCLYAYIHMCLDTNLSVLWWIQKFFFV